MTSESADIGEGPSGVGAVSGRGPSSGGDTDNPDETLLSMRSVSYSYPDGTDAVGSVSLAIKKGEIIGIVGPSGCGKSSFLSVVAGLANPTGGAIKWQAGGDAESRHRLAMVFQKDTLLPWLTVERNVNFFTTLNRRRRKAVTSSPVDEMLSLAGLQDFRTAYPYQLSGGMRRRAAFVSAMASMPRLLLLDEPFSSLDEPTRIAIHQDVLQIVRRVGVSVLLVTHDLAEAASLCDRVIVLTNRPATVASEHVMPFGRDRDVLGLRQDPRFLEAYGNLWHDLSLQIQGA